MADPGNLLVLLIVVGARFFVPLLIPRFPLPAGIAALVIDGVDQTIFQAFTTLPLAGYQSYDKALDVYYLSIEYLSTMRNWSNLAAFQMSRFLFYFRLFGSLLFELTQVRALLLLFPNTFEYFFLFYEAVRLRWNPKRMSTALVIGAAFAIWVLIKVPQEFWIHIAQFDVTDMLRLQLFGVPLETSWGAIVAANVPFFVALIAVILVGAGAARWAIIHRLPPADWALSLDADAHGRDVTPEEAFAMQRAGARRLFDAALFEKIALVSLVTVIFSRILPRTQASALSIAIGVGLLIIANTVVSEWLMRRGVRWQSSLVEFVAMAAVNIGIVAIFAAVLFNQQLSLDTPFTLFAVLLLTLLVTMYDRFQPYHAVRVARARAASPLTAGAPRS